MASPVFEIAQIDVKPGAEADFEAAVRAATPLFKGSPGCHSLRLLRSIEEPGRYRLFVKWETVEAHNAFRETSAFTQWRALAGPHFLTPPQIEHVADIVEGF